MRDSPKWNHTFFLQVHGGEEHSDYAVLQFGTTALIHTKAWAMQLSTQWKRQIASKYYDKNSLTSWTPWKDHRNPQRPADNPYLFPNGLAIL